ncbi:single-stranded DNA-binding protein [Escherichia coli]|uniref:single-stranded DNA-binding protein n=1 Tax=Escherichia coli TaxID=562 RepID=UPI001C7026F9|nr:single-stranded DNA-binding protein [Escherichia coli]ELV8319617.1 single-stranded DNA-binding protein [Escherichia coli]MBW9678856.1 single-stranded DNA-binding protein [Escherichia coli]
MTAQIAAYGRLVDDPQVKQTSKGTPMTLARMAVPLPCSQWTGQNGETRQGWQVIADSVISARTARPGGKKGQQGQATDALNRAKQQAGNDDPYGDNIPF